MTIDEEIEILKALDEGRATRAETLAALVAKGLPREAAEELLAQHTGESEGDVIE